MTTFWTSLFTARTWNEWLAANRAEAGFPASSKDAVAKIQVGDILLCYVSSPISSFVGAFQVAGNLNDKGTGIWYTGDYPLRFPVVVEAALPLEKAIAYKSFDFLPTMASNHGGSVPSRGQIGSNARKFDPSHGEKILRALVEAHKSEPAQAAVFAGQQDADEAIIPPVPDVSLKPDEATAHLSTQYLIAKLGTKLGFQIWIARNDKNRLVNGARMGDLDGTLKELPRLSANDRIQSIIELIDVLWLRNGDCVAAFEIECTTSVFSGLLRMSDLITLQPNLAIPMYLVAPEARRDKVVTELMRPTFCEGMFRPLHKTCRYLPIEKLGLLEKIPDELWDSMKMSVIEKMSEAVEMKDAR